MVKTTYISANTIMHGIFHHLYLEDNKYCCFQSLSLGLFVIQQEITNTQSNQASRDKNQVICVPELTFVPDTTRNIPCI